MFWAATSRNVYRHTIPTALLHEVFGEEADRGTFSASEIVRKLYSVVAFTLVGFVAHKALPPTRRPALRAALIVGAFSGCIEIAQTLRHAPEGWPTHVFDVGCGALGGWLGVMLDRTMRRRTP